jgi:hypothetical protein
MHLSKLVISPIALKQYRIRDGAHQIVSRILYLRIYKKNFCLFSFFYKVEVFD